MIPGKIELFPMLCLKCQQPIAAAVDEVVWVCQNCLQGMVLSDEKGLLAQAIHYSINLSTNQSGKPVWVASGQVDLQRETYSGNLTREMQEFWAQPHWFFVPAYELTLDQLAESGVQMLRQPLVMQETTRAAPFLPVTVHPEDIQPLAEYLVLALEAERRDQLKKLTFNLRLGLPELWIFA